MRLTFEALGWTWDWSLAPTSSSDEASEFEAYQDAGTIASTPVGVATTEVPWEDAGSLHQFDPGEDGEDRRRRLGFGG